MTIHSIQKLLVQVGIPTYIFQKRPARNIPTFPQRKNDHGFGVSTPTSTMSRRHPPCHYIWCAQTAILCDLFWGWWKNDTGPGPQRSWWPPTTGVFCVGHELNHLVSPFAPWLDRRIKPSLKSIPKFHKIFTKFSQKKWIHDPPWPFWGFTIHQLIQPGLAGASNQCPSTVAGIAVVVLLGSEKGCRCQDSVKVLSCEAALFV